MNCPCECEPDLDRQNDETLPVNERSQKWSMELYFHPLVVHNYINLYLCLRVVQTGEMGGNWPNFGRGPAGAVIDFIKMNGVINGLHLLSC